MLFRLVKPRPSRLIIRLGNGTLTTIQNKQVRLIQAGVSDALMVSADQSRAAKQVEEALGIQSRGRIEQ